MYNWWDEIVCGFLPVVSVFLEVYFKSSDFPECSKRTRRILIKDIISCKPSVILYEYLPSHPSLASAGESALFLRNASVSEKRSSARWLHISRVIWSILCSQESTSISHFHTDLHRFSPETYTRLQCVTTEGVESPRFVTSASIFSFDGSIFSPDER